MATSDLLVEQTTRHQVYLEGLKGHQVKEMTRFLVEVDELVRKRLGGKDLTEFSRSRLERLLESLSGGMGKIYGDYWEQLELDLDEIAQYEAGFESRSLNNVLENFETVVPAAAQVRAAVFSAPLSVRGTGGGLILEDFVSAFSETQIERVTGAIRQGYFEGQTTSQIIQRVRGTRANNYEDGILALSARDSESVVRTAVQEAAIQARAETWEANDDIVIGYRWLSTLDGRTTTQCRSLDNQVFKLDKGPMPPIHYRCRSTTAAELDGRYSFDDSGQRASMDGPVNADLTYYSWLKRQPASFQDDVLGPARGKLLRDGGLTSDQFAALQLGRNFQPLTLEEMRQREPIAFRKAFGDEQVTD